MSDPIVTVGALPDGFMLPSRPRRGIKPYKIDDAIIRKAIDGRNDGLFDTPEQAAYALANERYARDDKRYNAYRQLLRRRLKQYFI